MIVDLFFLFLNAKGSKFGVQPIIFTIKYIEIRKVL